MKRLLAPLLAGFALLIPLLPAPQAAAVEAQLYCYQGPTNPQWAPCSSTNQLQVSASVSASITGFPGTTQTTGTPIAVTTGGVTGTLPAGTVVVASNVGATNGAYCKLGASATTSDQLIPPNSWFGFTVGTNTQLTCITSTSTTTVNMVGGAGLPTGSGGGGGGSGGGVVTQPTASLLNATVVGTGTFPTQLTGATNNINNIAGTISLPTGAATSALQTTGNTTLTTINTTLGSPFQAGGNIGNITGTITLPTGAATSANQSTEITSLATIATNTGAAIPSQSPAVPIGGIGVCDGANGATNPCTTAMTVKAVSTAPVTATDKAAVTVLRPDSPGIITLGPAADTSAVPEVLTPTANSNSTLSHASTTALGTSLVAKASAGNLYGFNCAAIAGASGGNCIAYNGTTVPGTGALTGANVLDFCTFDTGSKGCSLSRIPLPVNYGTGIVILISSAASPYTYTTGTDTGAISVDYK